MAIPSIIIPYDPHFLGGGFHIPLPEIKENYLNGLFTINSVSEVLDYIHYSLRMNKDRKTAIFTAANVDGIRRYAGIDESGYWKIDSRIRKYQLGEEYYKNNPWDKGHLLRRVDVVWGDTYEEAKEAEKSTFYYTNAALQHENFNRDEWKCLEDWVLRRANNNHYRLCVFTGPVFSNEDGKLSNTDHSVRIPSAFWKVMVMRDNKSNGEKISSTAFIMKQNEMWEGRSDAKTINLKTYQIPVKTVERVTGLKFCSSLKEADEISLDEYTFSDSKTCPEPWHLIKTEDDIITRDSLGKAEKRAFISLSSLDKEDNKPLGSRMQIWKQDPSEQKVGIRTIYVHGEIEEGPKDSQIAIKGIRPVKADENNDFLVNKRSKKSFDAVHTFAIVRQTLTMYQRLLKRKIGWQWGDSEILVYPHTGQDCNARYCRDEKALKFYYFNYEGKTIYTCRSLDIIAHETGHAILDSFKPNWWPTISDHPQTGGLHESFADLTTIFLIISQYDLTEYIIAETKADLHYDKTIVSNLAEEFGKSMGQEYGLRNADNNYNLEDVDNSEVHEISKVFTGAIYDILADIFNSMRKPRFRDDATVLYEAGQYVMEVVVNAILMSPDKNATFYDVKENMLRLVRASEYPGRACFIEQHFTSRLPKVQQTAGGHKKISYNKCCGTLNITDKTV